MLCKRHCRQSPLIGTNSDYEMYIEVLLVLLAAAFCRTNGDDSYVPPYIHPCTVGDDFERCVRKEIELSMPHFAKGIPELGVPSIDPVKLDNIKIDGNGLKLLFEDPLMHGLSKAILTDFKVNMDEEKFSLSVKLNISVTAKYTVDGQILVLPIKGKGDAIINTRNIDLTIKSKLIHAKDAKGDHLKLVTPNYKYDIEKTQFEFKNLFNGNKPLADATHQFANENWRTIMDELAPPAIKQIVKNTIKVINNFFSKVTIDQIIKGYVSRA